LEDVTHTFITEDDEEIDVVAAILAQRSLVV
jgi:hypothetical protein